MITLNKKFYDLSRCYLSGSESESEAFEQETNQQVGVGAGGAGVGSYSNGNIINVTTADVNALQANQNVSETAINAEGSTAAYALESLEQSQANSNVVVQGVIDNEKATADDASNVASTVATEGLDLASQAIAGSGYGSQTTYAGGGDNGGTVTATATGLSATTIALYLGIGVSIFTLYYYYNHK